MDGTKTERKWFWIVKDDEKLLGFLFPDNVDFWIKKGYTLLAQH